MTDAHTHNLQATDAIVNLTPRQAREWLDAHPHSLASIGIHPWDDASEHDLDLLEQLAHHPRVVAIGESGLDTLRGPSIERQEALFEQQVLLAEKVGKPMIIHCVKAWDRLLAIKRRVNPTHPWMIHGFRGKPQLARQLLDAGFYISLGQHFNPDTLPIIPSHRLLVETDESTLPVASIMETIASRHPSMPSVKENLTRFLNEKSVKSSNI